MDNMLEIVKNRHSVRSYKNKKIEGNIKQELEHFIEDCNKKGNLNIKLVLNEPKAFNTFISHYGKFKNVSNYIILSGKKDKNLEEKCGYYGEKIVIKASEIGLNTCWVGLTYGKSNVKKYLNDNDKIIIVIAIGYGENQGVNHKIKKLEDICPNKKMPEWFKCGLEYALLAPTAMNQQKFKFELIDNTKVKATSGKGFFTKVDLGIAKYHFELGAGTSNFTWID